MVKGELKREIKRTALQIRLLEDALLKFATQLKISTLKPTGALSSVTKSYADLQWLKKKVKYLKVLLWIEEKKEDTD